jgi:hypothetical protein
MRKSINISPWYGQALHKQGFIDKGIGNMFSVCSLKASGMKNACTALCSQLSTSLPLCTQQRPGGSWISASVLIYVNKSPVPLCAQTWSYSNTGKQACGLI